MIKLFFQIAVLYPVIYGYVHHNPRKSSIAIAYANGEPTKMREMIIDPGQIEYLFGDASFDIDNIDIVEKTTDSDEKEADLTSSTKSEPLESSDDDIPKKIFARIEEVRDSFESSPDIELDYMNLKQELSDKVNIVIE